MHIKKTLKNAKIYNNDKKNVVKIYIHNLIKYEKASCPSKLKV